MEPAPTTETPASTPPPAPATAPKAPSVEWSGKADLHGRWAWLPWPPGLSRAGLGLTVRAGAAAPISWVVQPMTEDAMAALSSDPAARSALSAGRTARHGSTEEGEPLPLELDGVDGLLVGVWGSGPWKAAFTVGAPPAAPSKKK